MNEYENEQTGSNKRIAKNTMMLYFRMLLTMGVSLYTSRVVLNTLGVQDYGIYNIVGGVIMMFGFLNSSMSGATSRFLTFELGRRDYEKLKKTFSAALTVHFIIAAIILILGETIGLWWLETKLVIPPDRMIAARWVYQLSILSTIFNITQVPYNATIIAHERMGVFALVEIINKLLQLAIVFLLLIGNFDRLILYAALMLLVSVIIRMIYRIYCTKNFPESQYKFEWDKEIIKPMISFSGWNLSDNASYFVRTQGVNMLLNFFFGVVINAAYGIANQVQSIVNSLSGNFMTAVRPQIVKYYATGNILQMQNLVINSAKFAFLLMSLACFPLILESKFLLYLWLGQVPAYASVFSQLNLIYVSIISIYMPIMYAIHATGRIKNFSIINTFIYVLVIPLSYFMLKYGYSPTIPFVINIILFIGIFTTNLIILKKLIPIFSIFYFIKKTILNVITILTLSSITPLLLHFYLEESWIRLILVILTFAFVLCFLSFFIALNKVMRLKIVLLFCHKFKKW